MNMASFFHVSFIVFFVYFVLLVLYYLVLSFLSSSEAFQRQEEHERETYRDILLSDFTLPVSILVPMHNEEGGITDCVESILNLQYPQFELIIVNDGSTDNSMVVLSKLLELKHVTEPYKDRFSSGKLQGFYHSEKYPTVKVISKHSGLKKAGALNAAMNIAKYKYICSIDSDTILEPDALMKVMAQIQKDPEHVVGAGSFFGLSNGFEVEHGKIIKYRFLASPLIAYQNIEYIRSFMGNRIAWSSWNAMPIVSGGFQIWRRDIIEKIGGYDSHYSSEDLEFTFRVHDRLVADPKVNARVLMLPYIVGWTKGPDTIEQLIKQRNRWHRVTLEAVWKYKHMLFNSRYKKLGFLTMPYFTFYEALGPFFEVSSVFITLLGFAMGYVSHPFFFAMLLLMMLVHIISSLIPLRTCQKNLNLFNVKELAYFIGLILVEFFWYRWIIEIAKFLGTIDYLRGERKMDRVFM